MLFGKFSRGKKAEEPDETKRMIINVTGPNESRVAILDAGVLQELTIETTRCEKIRGNIYVATVQKVEPSLHAAFVEYGGNRPGFLPLDEVHEQYHGDGGDAERERAPAKRILHRGQKVVVQAVKEEKGNKGAAMTTYVSLPGRYMVLMPGENRTGVSRKIEDAAERQKLKDIGRQLNLPESMGFIIRTAGINKTKKELQSDANYLLRLWRAIEERSRELNDPGMIYQESSMVIQSIRDYYTSDIREVQIDDLEVYRRARDFFKQVMPKYQKRVRLYEGKTPIFSHYQVEQQIDPLLQRVVNLKSGGSICIDPTEALVAIDVNSARFTRVKDPEESALITNLEAADEIARQLRLRNLGGLIVIDFIDMRNAKNRSKVERQLKGAFKVDKANVELGRISKFGMLEMSRENLRPPLVNSNHTTCPCCGGRGQLRSVGGLVLLVLRELHEKAVEKNGARLEVAVGEEVALELLNARRQDLLAIERQNNVQVSVRSAQMQPRDSFRIDEQPVS